jgi:hypothetical protein
MSTQTFSPAENEHLLPQNTQQNPKGNKVFFFLNHLFSLNKKDLWKPS